MLKSSLGRSAGLCRRVVLSAKPIRIPSQVTAIPSVSPRVVAPGLLYRTFSSYPQLCNAAQSSAAAHAPDTTTSPGVITHFAELPHLGIDRRLVTSITDGMRYEKMTEVQSKTINPALAGKDLVAQAKTGTGKTLAFLVPIVQKILEQDPNLSQRTARSDDIRAIVISPTRELAEQIGAEALKLCRGTGIVVQVAVGGTRKSQMLYETRRRGCHLLIATPGRLNDLLDDPRSGIDAPNLDALVLDEADRMLDVGFEKELSNIVRNLPDRRDKPRQTLLFSATMPRNVINLARSYVDPGNFQFVQTIKEDETPTHEKVPQHIVRCDGFANIHPTLLELISRESAKARETPGALPFKAIVFLPTTAQVEFSEAMMRGLERSGQNLPRLLSIHSKLTQSQRTYAANRFRNEKSAVLVSSDVTARGMDFPNVTHVIQVHLPPDQEQYIHRLGRTGRAGKSGEGWIIITKAELNTARRRLGDLPIQPHNGLKCASFVLDQTLEDAPEQFEAVKNVCSRIDPEILSKTYASYLNSSLKGVDTQTILDGINAMSRHLWGMPEPPAMPRTMIRHLPSSIKGLNFAPDERRRGSARRDHAFDGDFSADPFTQINQDDRNSRSSGFGGDRRHGNGERRSRSGGYGRGGYGRRDAGRPTRGGHWNDRASF